MIFIQQIRKIVLIAVAVWVVGVYVVIHQSIPSHDAQILRLDQIYALTALGLLYITVLASPLTLAWPNIRGKELYIHARRAIGVSAFFVSLLHGSLSFFGLLGGFPGLGFLSTRYIIAIILSFTALCIMLILTATAFDWAVRRLGRKWKTLHRFVYLAGVLIVIHALMLGSHFTNLSGLIPQIFFGALLLLLFLEARRFDRWLVQQFHWSARFGLPFGLMCIVLTALTVYYLLPNNGTSSLSIHAAHTKLAEQQQNAASSTLGDVTRRYSVSFDAPENVQPGKTVKLQFRITDAVTGAPILVLQPSYEKLMHIMIVSDDLSYFSHIHPTQAGPTLSVEASFPYDGRYHVYSVFTPLGGIEQQFAFQVTVGTPVLTTPVTFDSRSSKTFGGVNVELQSPQPLQASALGAGQQKLTFVLHDQATNEPINDIMPYLGAFGHLTMVNISSYESVHVHPSQLTPPALTDRTGPTVSFTPLALYGAVKIGTYKLFAEFNVHGHILVSDFMIKVE